MRGSLITGIDVGSAFVRIVVCEFSPKEKRVNIRALVKTPSDGLKNGYITNANLASESVGQALAEAERLTGERIKSAFVAVGGVGLSTQSESATVAMSRADGMVTELDVSRLLSESEARVAERPNIKVLHSIPSEFKIDGRTILGKPIGNMGSKLEIRTLFITAASPHLNSLLSIIESHGTEVTEFFALPIAESIVTLPATAKNAGCVLVDLGAESVSLLTYEDGLPTSLKIFPLGSSDITNDIALGLRITLEDAEQIKLGGMDDRKISSINKLASKKVNEIIEARLSDIFELIDTHLKRIGRSGLLPAGVIFTGAGSRVRGIDELGKRELSLPARVVKNFLPGTIGNAFEQGNAGEGESSKQSARLRERMERMRDPEWSAALGLCVLGMSSEPKESVGIRVARRTTSGIANFLRQFLP